MSNAEIAVRRLVEQIALFPHVTKVWLFGSRARGDALRQSDIIDVAVEAPDADIREWLQICDLADAADTLLPIDLVRMEEASPALRDQIELEGQVVYER